MVSLADNSGFYMYNANTKAAINMIIHEHDQDRPLAVAANNVNGFCRTINAWTAQI